MNKISKINISKVDLLFFVQKKTLDLKPDFVHVLLNGTIVKTGKNDLALKLEKEGYSWLK